MYPMSIGEFIEARGNPALAEAIARDPFADAEFAAAIHATAHGELREYLFCGGMPAAVHAFIESQDPAEVRNVHANILFSYASDFQKYAARISADLAEKLFINAPTLVGSRFKFNHIDPDRRASEIKPAVEALEKAGVIRRVFHTSAQAAPLAADTNPRISKLLFLDVGLMHASLNIEKELVQKPELLGVHRGAVAEQFVGQELLACTPPNREPGLWFWAREALNSQAEIDYVIAPQSRPIPIEVKSGGSGRLKSLRSFMDSHPKCEIGYRLYDGKAEKGEDRINHLPLYFAGLLSAQRPS
jgi:predicted AAA+ superfamily ATPase